MHETGASKYGSLSFKSLERLTMFNLGEQKCEDANCLHSCRSDFILEFIKNVTIILQSFFSVRLPITSYKLTSFLGKFQVS